MPFDFADREELAAAWAYIGDPADAPRSVVDAHGRIEAGLAANALVKFRDTVRELTDATWAEILLISLSQFKRLRTEQKPLSKVVGSQLMMFAFLLTRAEDVFGSRSAALDWFMSEQMALSGRKPIDLLDTFVGAALVDRTLRQLDYGVYV